MDTKIIFILAIGLLLVPSNAHEQASAATPQAPQTPNASPKQTSYDREISQLRSRGLTFPIANFDIDGIKGSFHEIHGGSQHNAVDIPSAKGTEIHAVDDGSIAKLFQSKAGGTTIYQYDSNKTFVYYYAHLQGYAPNLKDGQKVKKGQVLGFVGTSGNAPPDSPHLHFEVTLPCADKKWWQATPIDPYLIFKK